ncbi:MAG TPA: c-type cytochrome, partial [Halomonas sp.]|nr:c-type cytochrome [Halomonas sp.]
MKFSKLIMGCMAALGLSAGAAVAQEDAERAAIAERLAPVGELCVQGEDCGTGSASAVASADSAASGAAEVSGEDIDAEAIYNSLCMACHATGAAGAPIYGDEAAWADRVTKGFDTLLDHSINGFNAMPARGGNPNLSDEEMLAVTRYMLEPVMDVPAGETADDEAATPSNEAAASDDAAPAEDEAQVAAADGDAAADETQQAAVQDDAEPAADSGQEEATEVAGADLPGAGKIGV